MTIRDPACIGGLLAGEQPDENDLDALKAQGVRSIINLRQAGENAKPTDPEQERRQAEERGLSFVHLPIAVPELSTDLVERFQDLVNSLPGPVYVHCGLGQRAVTLALILDAATEGTPANDAIARVEAQGYAISLEVRDFIRTQLDGEKTGTPPG